MRLLDFNELGPKARGKEAPSLGPVSGDAAVSEQAMRIGEFMVRQGLITRSDVENVLEYQVRKNLRFGEAAIKLKLVKRGDVDFTLAQQYACPTPGADEFSEELVAAYNPADDAVESLRYQRSLLVQHYFDTEPRALAVVSANRGDGRSFMAANLAVLMAQLGRETLLIDGDLRKPRLHRIFQIENDAGLSSVLGGRTPTERLFRFASLPNLAILPAGGPPPNPLELLSRDRFSELLRSLLQRFQIVLIDTPNGKDYAADTQMIAGRCRGALLLTRMKRTRLNDAHALVQRLARAKVNVIGAVMNRR